jgi:hypothetical protein
MADTFKLLGSYETVPLGSVQSFAESIIASINESVVVVHKQVGLIDLSSDSPAAVSFGGVASANIITMKATGKVKARLTSADGSVQAIPFDDYFILMSRSVPITAIDLTRVSGVATTVRVFLGEKA